MAHCLRHVTTKFTSLPSFFASRKHAVRYEKLNLLSKNIFEQYSTQPKCKAPHISEEEDLMFKTLRVRCHDNRECSSDIVTKGTILDMNNHSLSKLMSPRLNFSSPKPVPSESDLQFSEPESNKPSPDKLSYVYEVLMNDLPKIFTRPFDYTIYHSELVFENNIKGTTTVGLLNYIKQISFIKVVSHIKFAYVKMEVLRITKHSEDSTVKVRWRIRGIPTFKVMVNFWKFAKFWNYREYFDQADIWYDGFSTFYINTEGTVYKHVADKMMPDSEDAAVKNSVSPLGTAKLALLAGLIPKLSDFYSIT